MSVTLEQIERVQINGKRWYQVKQGEEIIGTFPSVTSVLKREKGSNGATSYLISKLPITSSCL